MQKLKCKECGSNDIKVDVGHSTKFTIDDDGYREFELSNAYENEIIGDPFCSDCGEDYEESN